MPDSMPGKLDRSESIGGRWGPEHFNLDGINAAVTMAAAGRFTCAKA